jgi:hypothetical protein
MQALKDPPIIVPSSLQIVSSTTCKFFARRRNTLSRAAPAAYMRACVRGSCTPASNFGCIAMSLSSRRN